MQNKHVIIVHANEDRDIFINKCNIPKTVIHVGNNPQPGDLVMDPSIGFSGIFATWILNNWDNLPDFLISSQANPDDHVHRMDLAIKATFTCDYGNLGYGRALWDQYTIGWVRILPLIDFAKEFGCNFINGNNNYKLLFPLYPGDHFYISKKKIYEKGKDFFKKLIYFDNTDNYLNFVNNIKFPQFFKKVVIKSYPHLSYLSFKEKFNKLSGLIEGRNYGYFGWVGEHIYPFLFMDKEMFNILNLSQACIDNKFYFNTNDKTYDLKFSFSRFPYVKDLSQTVINMKLLENNWFDWDCPHYLKWRETLIEKTIWEGEQRGFDGRLYLKYLEQSGYKHISL